MPEIILDSLTPSPVFPESAPLSCTPSRSKAVCLFLTEYAECLLGCGATCIRLEKNVERIARAFGKRVELTIMPRHIHMTVWQPGCDDIFTSIASVKSAQVSFSLNTYLSRLSWDIADRSLDLPESERLFKRIVDSDGEKPYVTLALASVANASFCGIFGGDVVAMGIVSVATALGFALKQQLIHRHVDGRIVFFLCALLSTVLGSMAYMFPDCSTPAVAIGTSVLYLVPGIPFINSFSDMLYKHYVCAFSRFMDALVLTACLSLGLCLGMWVMDVSLF